MLQIRWNRFLTATQDKKNEVKGVDRSYPVQKNVWVFYYIYNKTPKLHVFISSSFR